MRKVLCCSTQNFQNVAWLEGISEDFQQRLEADEVVFRTFAVGKDFNINIDWEEVKKEDVVIVVLCDDPHQTILHNFFQEAVFKANLLTFWYTRSTLFEIKPMR